MMDVVLPRVRIPYHPELDSGFVSNGFHQDIGLLV